MDSTSVGSAILKIFNFTDVSNSDSKAGDFFPSKSTSSEKVLADELSSAVHADLRRNACYSRTTNQNDEPTTHTSCITCCGAIIKRTLLYACSSRSNYNKAVCSRTSSRLASGLPKMKVIESLKNAMPSIKHEMSDKSSLRTKIDILLQHNNDVLDKFVLVLRIGSNDRSHGSDTNPPDC